MNVEKQEKRAKDFEIRLKSYFKDQKNSLKRNSLVKNLFINFPDRARVPFLSQIAIWVLHKQGGIIDTQFTDIKYAE